MKRAELLPLVLIGLLPCPISAAAQTTGPTPIAEAFVDLDGDRIPDRLGDSVVVEGVLLSQPLVIGWNAALANLQDRTGGVTLFTRDTTMFQPLDAGDSVRVRGTVGQYRGAEQVLVAGYELLGHTAVPAPRDALVSELLGERLSGRLVRVRGTLSTTATEDGWIATLGDRTGRIPVHISAAWLTDPDFVERLRRGGDVEIVGIASQSTSSDLPDDGYRLYPRGIEDFELEPVPPYEYMAFALALAIIAGLLLWRRVTARRAAKLERLASELEASREALRIREERFRSLVEHASDTVSIIDRDGVVLYQSASVTKLLGWTPEELVGRSALEHVHPEDRSRIASLLSGILDEPEGSREAEFRFRAADGAWHDLELVATNRIEDAAVGGIVCNIRDVTQHNILKERLRQADRLETVGRLAGGVAHDFNNILTALRGHAEMALQEMADNAPGRADVREIVRNVGRASEVTGKLLAFTRQQATEPTVVAASTVVRDMLPTLRRLIGANIEIEAELATMGDKVEVDPSQLERVILNLVINARDAMPDGGRISLEVFEDEITEDRAAGYPYRVRSGSYVHIGVSDTGIGMEDEVLSHVFEPFFTTKGPGEGTGLGLATAYGIVKQSMGYIWAQSEPGGGTQFDIYLPQLPPDQLARRQPAEAPVQAELPVASRKCILLVEDEVAVRDLVARVLRKHGYRVLEADGADQALARVTEKPCIDLLITDVVMPGLSGVKLAEILQKRLPELPVLFISGYTAGEAVERHGSGNAVLLEKPFTPQQILRQVRESLSR